jgi:hypothetical protein
MWRNPHSRPAHLASAPVLVDADGMVYEVAYATSGKRKEVQARLQERLDDFRTLSSEPPTFYFTAEGSSKGRRYDVATVKPYQGNRDRSNRPESFFECRKNLVELCAVYGKVYTSSLQEADDRIATAAEELRGRCFIVTADKDMRVLPGVHVANGSGLLTVIRYGDWDFLSYDLVYGEKWFWFQMLQGDSVDNIPGLPGYRSEPDKPPKRVGPVAATRMLARAERWEHAEETVSAAYENFYGAEWAERFLEQAQLLWLQRSDDPLDVYKRFSTPLQHSLRGAKEALEKRLGLSSGED